jgi:hypothetical protein
MHSLFSSQDSKFMIKTAFLVTCVPLVMILIVMYSVWLMLVMNFSYFRSGGFPLDKQQMDDFVNYLLQSQVDYFPYVGLFIVGVFFVGLFLGYITLRPFNQLIEMCHLLKEFKGQRMRIVGLERKKLIVKLGNFLCEYAEAKRNQTSVVTPPDLEKLDKPSMDGVFYFQFFCIMLILLGITVSSIYFFTTQLQESTIQSMTTMLKSPPTGMSTFLASQEIVFDFIVIVPSVFSLLAFLVISRTIISRIQGVTYAYVRDVCDVARGNTMRRLHPRSDDPGRDAASAVNEILDIIHPRYQKPNNEVMEEDLALKTRPV